MTQDSPNWNILKRLADDQRVVAQRQWQAPSKAPAVQRACDIGLFSDEHKQIDLFTANKGK